MARLPLSTRTRRRNMALRNMMTSIIVIYYYMWSLLAMAYKRRCLKIKQRIRNIEQRKRNVWLSNLIRNSEAACISQLRMDRRTFYILCEILSDVGGLKATRNMSLEEIVAQFLYTLSHHLKNSTIKEFFFRSESFGCFRWNSYQGNSSN
ncbi:hypothetical protein SETIT_3G309200v2 [Setaria italica]|uniref:DUF8040 domain-containing protein n=1 Tax=Setaria italica TaxID=4555 RepID=A0A368QKV0_SETIT|nr:hypothetical protein SETIT_3G309200v2 [Setaria italica]